MRLKCTNCPAEMEVGANGEDVGDTAYRLLCPILRDHRKEPNRDVDLECPYMRDARSAAIRKLHTPTRSGSCLDMLAASRRSSRTP